MLIRAIVFILLVWNTVVGVLHAQQGSPVFDLLTKLRLAHHDTARMDIHIQLADIYISDEADAERAIDHANLALILAQNYKDQRRQFLALDKLIRAHYELRYDVANAMNYLKEAKKIDTTQLSQVEYASLLGNEGKIFLGLNDYERSQEMFLKQLSVYEKYNYKEGIAKVNFNLGGLFFEQNDFDQALLNYQKSLDYAEELNDVKGKMKTLNAMGQTRGRMQDYTRSLSACSDALLLARASNDRMEIAKINANLGFACEHLGRYDDALEYYNTALDVAEEMNNKRLVGQISKELGNIHLATGDEMQAGVFFAKALASANATDSKLLKKNIYESLWPFYEQTGKDSLAYDCLKKLLAIKDELYNDERTRHLINNQIRYETEQREQEVKQLKARELESKLTIQKQRMSNYVLIIVVLLALILVVALYNAFRRKKSYNEELEKEVKKRTSDLEKSNAQLKESNHLLEQSNVELERFAYIASHDLKSPLRNVISFLNLIERKLKPVEDQNIAEYLRFASENARQMHQLIQDVLEFSRVNSKDHSKSQVDLNETLMLISQNLKDEMERKNAVVFANYLPVIEANSVHILQLLQNLISNGLKYNRSKQPRVVVSHRAEEEKHVFSVRDNGIGISPEYHEQIFEMFKRLHTKEEFAGTGIGLALCRKIVHNHGGSIWLESSEGQGTTFYFSIPKEN
jgi:signal transduction histidine kinase